MSNRKYHPHVFLGVWEPGMKNKKQNYLNQVGERGTRRKEGERAEKGMIAIVRGGVY